MTSSASVGAQNIRPASQMRMGSAFENASYAVKPSNKKNMLMVESCIRIIYLLRICLDRQQLKKTCYVMLMSTRSIM